MEWDEPKVSGDTIATHVGIRCARGLLASATGTGLWKLGARERYSAGSEYLETRHGATGTTHLATNIG